MRFPGPLRDALVLLLVLSLLLGGLFLYAGTWPPAVIVESSSMAHAASDVPYGRLGTIDPGDLVVVKAVASVDDVTTLVEGGRDRYGLGGDVIVYQRGRDAGATPIIHRAVAYAEVVGEGPSRTYRVRWDPGTPCEGGARKDGAWCLYGRDGIVIPSIPVWLPGSTPDNPLGYQPRASGFITKGDNPLTNARADVFTDIYASGPGPADPVPLSWILGKARGELPWLGLIKLSLAGQPNEANPPASYLRVGSAYAPPDLWVMLAVSLGVLVGAPFAWDLVRSRLARRALEK